MQLPYLTSMCTLTDNGGVAPLYVLRRLLLKGAIGSESYYG